MQSNELIRFMSFVVKQPEGCWLWIGPLQHNGYGEISINGTTKTAHRVIYEHCFGDIGDSSWEVCHTCDIRNCVNPNHLFTALHSGNMIDCLKKDRHNFAKLTVAQIHTIREKLAKGVKQQELANEFHVNVDNISLIKLNKIWKDI